MGATEASVRAKYGREASRKIYATRSPLQWTQVRYRVGVRSFWISYFKHVVVAVETNSPVFRVNVPPGPQLSGPTETAGVGSRVYGGFSGECDVLGYSGACDRWLLGFRWSEDCQGWVRVYRSVSKSNDRV